jgi:hypothetical protein
MAYRVGIPYQNAEKIYALMHEGRLISIKNLNRIEHDKINNSYPKDYSSSWIALVIFNVQPIPPLQFLCHSRCIWI